jgi:DNA-3-methyladenine glycosylase II
VASEETASASLRPARTTPDASRARRRGSRGGLAHLRRADPVLADVIERVGRLPNVRDGRPERDDHYGALVRSIIGQQVSVHAARAIYARLTARFGGRPPTPAEILAEDPEALRTAAGMSRAKGGFLRSLAEHVVAGELELARLEELSEADVVAHMFLMFQLERPDVLPVGDLGIRRAVERAYGLHELPSPAQLEKIAEPWRPHRTLACRYLWRSLANEPT